MKGLAEKICVWPSLQEQHRHYSKIQTEHDLTHISQNVTHTRRPTMTEEPPAKDGTFVAKR